MSRKSVEKRRKMRMSDKFWDEKSRKKCREIKELWYLTLDFFLTKIETSDVFLRVKLYKTNKYAQNK